MDRNRLADSLASLILEDGKPDVFARRKELENLLSTLSNHEIRRFREQLNNLAMQMDICSHLPLEILSNVASYLELEDIFRLRSVSRSWHVNFSNPELCLELVQKHFPSEWERFADGISIAGSDDAEKKRLLEWFQTAAIALLRKLHGRYHSMSTYYYNYTKSDQLPQVILIDRQYNNGRVAFRTTESGVLIRDLRTGQTTQLYEEDRKRFQEWFLSDQYLVASTVSPNMVCAWSLGENDQVQSIRLPNTLVKMSGRGDQVGIVTTTEDILIWTIGGSLKSINTLEYTIKSKPATTNVFFPKGSRKIFVTCQNDASEADEEKKKGSFLSVPHRFSIHEYDTEGKLISFHSAEISPQIRPWRRMTPLLMKRKIFWRLDTRPYYSYTMTSKTGTTESSYRRSPDSSERRDLTILLASFDVYTKDFAFQTYHVPNYALGLRDALFWDDQAILPIFTIYLSNSLELRGVRNTLLLGVNNCNKVGPEPRLIPWYGKEDSINKTVVCLPPQPYWAAFEAVAWCWIGENNSTSTRAMMEYDESERLVRVCGDDDFVVLFGRENGMVVWCFDKNVDLPISWSRLDPTVSDELKSCHPLETTDDDT